MAWYIDQRLSSAAIASSCGMSVYRFYAKLDTQAGEPKKFEESCTKFSLNKNYEIVLESLSDNVHETCFDFRDVHLVFGSVKLV